MMMLKEAGRGVQRGRGKPKISSSRSGDICEDLMYFLKTHFLLTSTVRLEKFGQDMLAHSLDLTGTMGS